MSGLDFKRKNLLRNLFLHWNFCWRFLIVSTLRDTQLKVWPDNMKSIDCKYHAELLKRPTSKLKGSYFFICNNASTHGILIPHNKAKQTFKIYSSKQLLTFSFNYMLLNNVDTQLFVYCILSNCTSSGKCVQFWSERNLPNCMLFAWHL